MEILIATKKDLLERLKDIRAIEVMARDRYIKDLDIFSDRRITKKIARIEKDEEKHIVLLDNLIKLLS